MSFAKWQPYFLGLNVSKIMLNRKLAFHVIILSKQKDNLCCKKSMDTDTLM